ncbi:MAG: DNA mismatch repair endonuclease MutL [Polyangiaceae bacterium]
MKVHRLSNDLANQIAAGEVVERPSSVVKELVENALDAGATRIRIEIEQGGLARIRVTDDGEGMVEEDARLALERHATSKITSIEDLQKIGTFGFRGEALPSIASVSHLVLTTRARGADEGTELTVDGGGAPRVKPVGCAVGTSIEVRELFFNVPARRKFLKTVGTESAHVGEAVLMAALSRPDVTFVLARDGKVAREYLRVGTKRERAAQAVGEERLEVCLGERGPMRLEAHLAPPERARAGAVALHIFVNGRPVKDRPLARAVAQSYGSVLESGRYPVGVLYIDLPPEMVDVNVHPQKAEVRFADGRALFDAVTRELYAATSKVFAIPALGPPTRPWLKPQYRAEPAPQPSPASYDGLQAQVFTVSDNSVPQAPLFSAPAAFYSRLRFLAQVKSTFLLCEGDDGIYILDQHAAAERVTFDRLKKAFSSRQMATQRLLVPEVVELTALDVAALEEHADAIAALGMEVRAVGPSAVAVHATPKILTRAKPERLVRDLVAELTREAARPFGGAADLVLATMACHGSMRAGDHLSPDEASALLAALDGVDFSGHCPHGRPVVTRLAFAELERRVGR